MPATPHTEKHFSGSQLVRDVVIGMADGLTVPFALAAGLSGAVDSTRIVVTAGMAEIAAGSIAMGLGGFLAARGDAEHYHAELAREEREIREIPEAEVREVEEIFGQFGLEPALVAPVVAAFKAKPSAWVDFMMRFELGLERPDPAQALKTAGTIAGAYIIGGLVPLAPYFVAETNAAALWPSVAVTLVALGAFGWVKGRFTTGRTWRGTLQTMVLGGAAAFAAFSLARLFG